MRRGMSVPWGVCVPGGWVFQGDESSRGWLSRGMGVHDPDTLYIDFQSEA